MWLNSDGIRDVAMTWNETHESPIYESTFTFVPLKSVVAVEVREGQDMGRRVGMGMTGNKVVILMHLGQDSALYWIANTPQEMEDLDQFFTSVLSVCLYAS